MINLISPEKDVDGLTKLNLGKLMSKDPTGLFGCTPSGIIKILQDNNIAYEYQKSFDNCRYPITNRLVKFDFYINNNFLLEFDGYQHFYCDDKGWNTEEHLKAQIERDEFKNNWCKNNKIILKRIPYWKLNFLTLNDILGDNFIYKEEE